MGYISNVGRLKIIEIVITVLFCGAILATKYIRLPFRYALSIPLSIVSLYCLFLSLVPSYSTGPDKQAFFQTQKNKIISISTGYTPQEYIQIKTDDTIKKIYITTGQQEQEMLKEKTFIQYISPTTGTQTQVFFLSKNGGIIELAPQSSVEIQGLYPNHTEINIQKGTIFSYIPKEEESFFTLSTPTQQKSKEIQSLQKTFEDNKQQYIKKQRGNPFFYEPTSIQIQQTILDIAYQIFPQLYTEKKQNFEAFRQAINFPVQEKISVKTDTSAATQEIFQQGNRGREETKLYQWIHNFF